MVRLFARHPVNDVATWKKAYDDFGSFQAESGVPAHAVYQQVDDPNDVTVIHDFATIEEAVAFAESPQLKEGMEAAGVAGPPDIWLTNLA